jgi:hypothetical protein
MLQGTDPIVSIRTDEVLYYAWRNSTCPDQERSPRKEPTSPWARQRAHGLVGLKSMIMQKRQRFCIIMLLLSAPTTFL